MSTDAALEFSVDRDSKTITLKRTFAAARTVVWDAYTKSEILDQWWAPKPWKARTKTMDFRAGGHWHYAMLGPEGEEHWSLVNYKTIQAQKSFTGQDAFADATGKINKDLPQSEWEVIFADKGPATLVELRITYPDLAQLEATLQMGFKDGLSTAMEGLDELLASLKNR